MLKDILVKVQESIGVTNSNALTREQLLRYINTAGREMWDQDDLPGSTFENFFEIPVDLNDIQVTLPWYAAEIRGVKWAVTGQKITIKDSRPRYQSRPWHQPLLSWRVRQRTPLHTSLSIEGQLTFTLDTAQTEAVQFTVAGQTTTASNTQETVTLLPGETTKTTTKQWSKMNPFGVQSIVKDTITTCDVQVTDADDLPVAVIGSRQNAANNILVQISDYINNLVYVPSNAVEILYKHPYQALYFDNDVFQGQLLEDALVFRVRANWEAMQKDEMAMQRAMLLNQKADAIVRRLVANQESEVEMNVENAPDRFSSVIPFWNRGGSKFNSIGRRNT